jgi:hypothetical protein
MMETQNITLSLPKNILRKVKLLAVERGTSISGLLTQVLEEMVDEETGYANARQRQIQWLARGFDLGLINGRPCRREELHER